MLNVGFFAIKTQNLEHKLGYISMIKLHPIHPLLEMSEKSQKLLFSFIF